ncbi:hypothetical protein EW145_g6472 [Phellinidium pouzarii]|uniref:Uncharacterized protein n=1 Tax=Phellinidium pouzarii TaxID=167371 RepID=A0A4S4KWI0_9AGAM|nr:hypothetical protein EW145_g6472 [Phellinidium pouzarii]
MPVSASVSESGKTLKDSKDLASGRNGSHALKHRRLSSTGQTKRRMSDARDAVSRPNAANISAAASALASLSLLTLSPSGIAPAHTNLHSHPHHTRARSQTIVNKQYNNNNNDGRNQDFQPASYGANPTFNSSFPITIASRGPPTGAAVSFASSVPTFSNSKDMAASAGGDIEIDVEDLDDSASVVESVTGHGANKKGGKGGRTKKRGTIFQCECCSKAAAVLSHLGPKASLPEDRSLWPSYLSNGLLPPPSTANVSSTNPLMTTVNVRANFRSTAADEKHSLVSSSVPVGTHAPRLDRYRSGSAASTSGSGPRMHDYTVQGGITQIRPGLLAHSTTPAAAPTRMLAGTTISPYADADEDSDTKDEGAKDDPPAHSIPVTSPSKSLPMAVPNTTNNGSSGAEFGYSAYGGYRDARAPESVFSASGVSAESLAHSGGWSLPHSDLRSSSVARSTSYSASRAGSRSDEEDSPEGFDEEGDGDDDVDVADAESAMFEPAFESYPAPKYSFASRGVDVEHAVVKKELEDDWTMEMDMDL